MSQTPSPLSGRPLDRTYVPTTGVPARLVLPKPDCFTLSCGAAVRLLERHDLPVVAVEALLPGGAGATPVAHAGLATLTADMLDEGAGGRSALALARTLEGLGAGFDSVAGYEDSRVRLWVLSPRLPEALSVMADVLMRPTLASDELDRVRCERMDTVLQLRDEPGSLAGDALASLLYGPGHPWGQSLLGTRASLGGITRDDVVRYHAERYQPGNITFVVAGDVTEAVLRELLEERFAGWEGRTESSGIECAVPEPDGTVVHVLDRPRAAQSEVRVGRISASRCTPDYFSVVALNTILGGAFTSRLNARLREEKGFTYGAHSTFHMRRSPGPFIARAAVHTPVTDQTVRVILEELTRLVEEPVPEGELERAKRYVALRLPQAFEALGDLVTRIAEQVLYGLPEDYWATYVPQLLAVDRQEVRAAAQRYLDPQSMTVLVVGDRAAIEERLRGLEIPVRLLTEEAA